MDSYEVQVMVRNKRTRKINKKLVTVTAESEEAAKAKARHKYLSRGTLYDIGFARKKVSSADPRRAVIRRLLTARRKPEKAIYTAVFLDDPNDLLDWWERETGLPTHPKVFSHHMTIKFKPSPDEVLDLPMGAPVTLRIVGWSADEKGQVVAVKPQGVRSGNRIPHVSVAMNGVSPVYSNELLELGLNPASGILRGRVGYKGAKGSEVFDLRGTIYDEPS